MDLVINCKQHDSHSGSHFLSLRFQGMSLADRQALQRAQQLKFLKKQGLINHEADVRKVDSDER